MFFFNTFKPQPPCKHRFHYGMVFIIYEVARVADDFVKTKNRVEKNPLWAE